MDTSDPAPDDLPVAIGPEHLASVADAYGDLIAREAWRRFDASPQGRASMTDAYRALITGDDPMPFNTSHALAGDWTMEPVPVALDGMMDLPPRKIPAPAGGWCVPPGEERMAALYAEAAYWRSKVGGEWLGYDGFVDLPAPPTDEEVMQPIVEAAMRAEGMSAPLRPIIPTIMRGRRHDGR